MTRILILTSRTGGGHVSLAESLRDRLQHDYTVEIVDPQPGIIHLHYRLVSRHALGWWGAGFKLANTPGRSLSAHKAFTALFARNVGDLLERSQPDLIMTTYPFLTYEVVHAMQQIGVSKPLVMLFSDANGVHASWLTERKAAATFAPTQETLDQALAAGFPPERLHFTGWPVRSQFYETNGSSRAEVMSRLGLDRNVFTIFLQGGGEGAARFARTVENLLSVKDIQIILAAGTNKTLFDRFSSISRIRALPFTKQIAPYMAAADVVMGKVGPNMLLESVTLGKPFIATTFIPGQEEVNLEFIRRHKLGWVALEWQQQHDLVQTLITTPSKLDAMMRTVHDYRRWNTEATKRILPLTRALL